MLIASSIASCLSGNQLPQLAVKLTSCLPACSSFPSATRVLNLHMLQLHIPAVSALHPCSVCVPFISGFHQQRQHVQMFIQFIKYCMFAYPGLMLVADFEHVSAAHSVSGILALVLLLRWLCSCALHQRRSGTAGRDGGGEQALHCAAGSVFRCQHTCKLLPQPPALIPALLLTCMQLLMLLSQAA